MRSATRTAGRGTPRRSRPRRRRHRGRSAIAWGRSPGRHSRWRGGRTDRTSGSRRPRSWRPFPWRQRAGSSRQTPRATGQVFDRTGWAPAGAGLGTATLRPAWAASAAARQPLVPGGQTRGALPSWRSPCAPSLRSAPSIGPRDARRQAKTIVLFWWPMRVGADERRPEAVMNIDNWPGEFGQEAWREDLVRYNHPDVGTRLLSTPPPDIPTQVLSSTDGTGHLQRVCTAVRA